MYLLPSFFVKTSFVKDSKGFCKKNFFLQVDCSKGPESDKYAFGAFVKELHDAFKPRGLLLSAAVSPSKTVVDAGYDVPTLGEYLDWVSVMTYDFHGQWDKRTGHVAPLYYHKDDEFFFFNAVIFTYPYIPLFFSTVLIIKIKKN